MKILQGRVRGAYGLEIVADSEGSVKRGSVYVLLGRLEEKGFVRIVKRTVPEGYQGPPRPLYALSGEGARVLALAESVGITFAGARA